MIHWYYVGGAVRIVEIQQNSLRTRKSMVGHTVANAMSANRAVRGSAVIKALTKRSAVLPTKNCEN